MPNRLPLITISRKPAVPMTIAASATCPGTLVLLAKIIRSTLLKAHGLRMRLGMAMLLINFPLGYGSLLLSSLVAAIRQDGRWLVFGTAGYASSWLVLAGGTALVGYEAKNTVLKTYRRKWAAWQRFTQKRYRRHKNTNRG